jgi:bleomycin hydrolase
MAKCRVRSAIGLSLSFCFLFSLAGLRAQQPDEKIPQALAKIAHPSSVSEFQTVPHLSCLNQGKTSICWSFATCSFVESEMARLKLEPVRLSVTYPAYCTYLEKARRFVREKGKSRVNPGDLFMGVWETSRDYGAIPASAYGQPAGAQLLDNTALDDEIDRLMGEVRREGKWDEADVMARATKILNRHLGEPPKNFAYKGKTYTPKTFLTDVVRLPWNDYIMLTSFQYAPFNTFIEFRVPDNWEHNTNFLNLPLPEYYEAFKGALKRGFSVAVSIDTTEPSYRSTGKYCFIPDFELPAPQINQTERETRFQNGSTTDDHAVHFIGWKNVGGEDWFLAKDSWKSVWRNGNGGNLFVHSSYVKMKVLAFIVHRDGVPDVPR